MTTVTRIRPRLEIRHPSGVGVRLVAALLRCTSCKHEWHGALDPFGEVVAGDIRCPRCSQHEPPAAA